MLGDSGEVVVESSAAGEEEEDVKLEDSGERAAVAGGGGGGGGNRWPRPETLALLRIRSEMDSAFRDSTLKAPLWEHISRKMLELGYKRSAKKCKEKFENVYKYHKRTKEGRLGKPDGKSYRFFDELQAFESLHSYPPLEPKSRPTKPSTMTTTTTTTETIVPWIGHNVNPPTGTSTSPLRNNVSVNPSSGTNPTVFAKQPSGTNPSFFTKQQSTKPFVMNHNAHSTLCGVDYKSNCDNFASNVSPLNLFSSSTSSSTASEEEEEEERSRKRRKRKDWKGMFKRLTKDLMEKQEEMHKRFLEALERHEEERIAREEAWRVQETARIDREYEILAHQRSASAAKDAAIISFLQKVSPAQPQQQQQQPQPQHRQYQSDNTTQSYQIEDQKHEKIVVEATSKTGNGDIMRSYLSSSSPPQSSSRWPKAEVEALIRLRTNVEANYQDQNGAKGSLWEEISAGMRRLGYSRSAKRCKEKWENINKYFKKVKESNKKRPLDSKTCPYFHQLEAIYKEKSRSATLLPPPQLQQQQLLPPQETGDVSDKQRKGEERDSEEEEEEEEDEEGEDVDDDDDDNETGGFEIVLNKTCSAMDINNNNNIFV